MKEPYMLWQHCFRRRNYGNRRNEPIDDLLLALDLLTPLNDNEKNITRKVVLNKMRATIVFKKKYAQLQEQKFTFQITHEVLDTLRNLGLIAWRYRDMFKRGEIAKRRVVLLNELLAVHDRMHVHQTLHLKKGIYQHFQGNDRLYRVIDVIVDTNKVLQVRYQQCYGEICEQEKIHIRPLSMFAQVIAQDGYVGPRWRLITEDEPCVRPELRLVTR